MCKLQSNYDVPLSKSLAKVQHLGFYRFPGFFRAQGIHWWQLSRCFRADPRRAVCPAAPGPLANVNAWLPLENGPTSHAMVPRLLSWIVPDGLAHPTWNLPCFSHGKLQACSVPSGQQEGHMLAILCTGVVQGQQRCQHSSHFAFGFFDARKNAHSGETFAVDQFSLYVILLVPRSPSILHGAAR